MKNYAVIDFSIGSVSLLIGGVEGRCQEVIFKTKTHLQLPDYMTSSGSLKAKGLERLLEEADSLIKKANSLNVEDVYAISTTLLRNLENADEIARKIQIHTGLELVNLSGADEAYAVYVANSRYRILEKAMLLHIGSSSTELCDYSQPRKDAMFSLDFGAETLARKFVKDLYPDDDELEDIHRHVVETIENCREKTGKRKFENAVVAGTNARAVYKVYRAFYDIEEKQIPLMQTRKLERLQKALRKEKKRTRLLLDNVPDKAYIILPVIETMLALLDHFNINDITVSSLGVKEGWFRYMMDNKNEDRETTD